MTPIIDSCSFVPTSETLRHWFAIISKSRSYLRVFWKGFAHWAALSKSEYERGLAAAGFEDVSVEFTHEVADGMHGAIVKAVKTTVPEKKGLSVIQPAAKAGCC